MVCMSERRPSRAVYRYAGEHCIFTQMYLNTRLFNTLGWVGALAHMLTATFETQQTETRPDCRLTPTVARRETRDATHPGAGERAAWCDGIALQVQRADTKRGLQRRVASPPLQRREDDPLKTLHTLHRRCVASQRERLDWHLFNRLVKAGECELRGIRRCHLVILRLSINGTLRHG